MNILILDSWLREFLKTEAKPSEIARCLSLCGPSVEKVTKKGQDFVYDIEITSNRPDMASIIGIAREAAVILPRFGIKARLVTPKTKPPLEPKKSLPLKVKIFPPSICPRFSAIVLDKVTIKSSPAKIKYRLEQSGIRALNNIVDIANYLMIETGQPIHTFDYDKIDHNLMVVRLSKKGEMVKTLDEIIRVLPGGDIVIEDGKKHLIDLCGIMGGANSAVDEKTRRVLFFVQSYDPVRIRRTSMLLAHRTEAAVRFEKGVDEDLILSVIYQGVAMNQKLAGAQIASKIYDFYSVRQKINKIKTSLEFINSRLGIKLAASEVKSILVSLGFVVKTKNKEFLITPPSWRADDIAIPEDLVEEVARLYGYHKLPSRIPVGRAPRRPQTIQLKTEEKIKKWLKNWGFSEIYNYSMISEEMLIKANLEPKNWLKLDNPLTEEWVYMRPSLIPSLLSVAAQNQENFPDLKIFEMANIYEPQIGKLPEEKMWLTGIMGQKLPGKKSFRQVKGVVAAILENLGENLGIKDIGFSPASQTRFWHPARAFTVVIKKTKLAGMAGEIKPQIRQNFGIKIPIVAFNLDVALLTKYAFWGKTYTPISQYPPIIEDLTFILQPKTQMGNLIQLIKEVNLIIKSVEMVDVYKDSVTFRLTYQSMKKTLTDQEVSKIRKKIIQRVKNKFNAKLKGKL